MRDIQPRQPTHLSLYAQACLNALVEANLAQYISIGGAFGLFHYLDFRSTHDVDAWWSDSAGESQRQAVIHALENALSEFGQARTRAWGDVVSVEALQDNKASFSFQIASRSARLQESVSANWIDIPLDSLSDLVAAKMVALIERGAPRDFLDIYSLCRADLLSVDDCWTLWQRRQILSGSEADFSRACLAIETHLERIAAHRPLENIADMEQRERSWQVRDWFFTVFLQVKDE